jgi:uncharacterized membrane protein
MTFTFSIRKALQQSWHMFTQHTLFFSTMAFVMIIFNLFMTNHTHNIPLLIIVIIAAVMWSYVWISVSLAAVDGKHQLLNFKALSVHMPTIKQFAMIVLVGLVVGLTVAVGFVLLIIPGIYFLTRLAFANIAYVDRQGSLKQSLSYSWHLVKGKIFWTVFLILIIEIVLVLLGEVTLMIGLLITYPIAMLLVTHVYRALTIYHRQSKDIPEAVVVEKIS